LEQLTESKTFKYAHATVAKRTGTPPQTRRDLPPQTRRDLLDFLNTPRPLESQQGAT